MPASKGDLGRAFLCLPALIALRTQPLHNCHFSFTKSKTKIAHIPTVIGNCTNTASRMAFPLGSAKVSKNIARAVSMPSASLVFEFTLIRSVFSPAPKDWGSSYFVAISSSQSSWDATHSFKRSENCLRSRKNGVEYGTCQMKEARYAPCVCAPWS